MNNNIYLYDGTFLNLLNLISFLIKNNIKPLNIVDANYEPTLLDKIINLKITNNLNIITNIKNSWGKEILKVMYYVYLSNEKYKELIIYYFYLNTLKYKTNILNMRNLKCVNSSLKIFKYVNNETHKLKGFIRFQELANHVLYAEIEPTNNCLLLLSAHFKRRLANEFWLIKDIKRNIISIYDKKNYYLISASNLKMNIELNKNELEYEDLWCTFYNTIGIKERRNDKLRLNFMPKKYWKHILEVSDKNEKSNK